MYECVVEGRKKVCNGEDLLALDEVGNLGDRFAACRVGG
jgi:hypothetical protein